MGPHVFIFYGKSGAGKGTQAKKLVHYFKENDKEHDTLYLQTGGLLREFLERDTYTSKKVKDTLDEGGLLPEFLPIWVWTEFFIEHFTGKENMVLDGVTRRLLEAPVLDGALGYYGFLKPIVVLLTVSDEWATERLKERGRYDDNDDDIKNRLDWYEENTVPAINYFKERPERFMFVEADGEQTREEVHQEIMQKTFSLYISRPH